MNPLNERSLKDLDGVHEDLVAVVMKAAEKADFYVTEGVRSKERQRELVKAGRSQTKNSRHLYGCAVDVCDTDGCYDIPDMVAISRAMKSAAAELGISIQWGGDWKTFKDTPHFELDRKVYPDSGKNKPWVFKPGTPTKVIAAATVATAVSQIAPYVPPVPVDVTNALSNVASWKAIGEQVWTLKDWAASQPLLAGALSVSITGFYWWSKKWSAP